MTALIIIAYTFIALFIMFILLVKNHEKTHDEWWGSEYTFGYICMALFWPVTMPFYVIYMAADAVVKTIKGDDDDRGGNGHA